MTYLWDSYRKRPLWQQLLVIFAIALGLRLLLIAAWYTDDLHHFQSGDYGLYYQGAEHIKNVGDTSNSLFLVRPPLFPFVIYLLNLNSNAVLLLNAFVGASIIIPTFILGRQVGLSEGLALLASGIVALDPTSIVYSGFLGPEPIANMLLLLMAVALLSSVIGASRPGSVFWAASAGAALALSAAARPAAFLLWVGLAIWLFITFRRVSVIVFAVVSLVGTSAWIMHNGYVLGNYTYSTISVYNMLYYRAVSVEQFSTGRPVNEVYTNLSTRVEERLGRDTSGIDSGWRHRHYAATPDVQRAMIAVALEVFRSDPLIYLLTIPVGIVRIYGWVGGLPAWTRPFEILWNVMLLLSAFGGLWFAFRRGQWLLFWLVFLIGAYFTAGTLIVQTSGMDTRMRSMLTPFLAVAGVYGLNAWYEKWLRSRQARTSEILPEA